MIATLRKRPTRSTTSMGTRHVVTAPALAAAGAAARVVLVVAVAVDSCG